jgi:hypothetical protein
MKRVGMQQIQLFPEEQRSKTWVLIHKKWQGSTSSGPHSDHPFLSSHNKHNNLILIIIFLRIWFCCFLLHSYDIKFCTFLGSSGILWWIWLIFLSPNKIFKHPELVTVNKHISLYIHTHIYVYDICVIWENKFLSCDMHNH